jgi:crotonobetainyl-CoA:carnitine CoA-transferase CaiB-like acyl-CoA transferase
MALPFSSLTILEATSAAAPQGLALAAGLCGRVLADLGAQVTRFLPAHAAPLVAAAELFLHRGKRSLQAGAQGDALLRALMADCDAAIVDAVSLEGAALPRHACVVLSMDGTDDPRQSDFTIAARSGLLDMVGDPQREPLRLGGHQTAYAAGLAAFTGLAAALANPLEGAAPAMLRVSLLETAIWLNWKALAAAELNGVALTRLGPGAEWPVLRCADGHVVLVHRAAEWPRLLAALPDPALHDARFATVEGRREHRRALNALLGRQVAGLTRAELHALSLRAKLPFGPVWRLDELLDDAQMRARDAFDAQGLPRLPVLWNGRRLAAAELATSAP